MRCIEKREADLSARLQAQPSVTNLQSQKKADGDIGPYSRVSNYLREGSVKVGRSGRIGDTGCKKYFENLI